MVAVILLVIIPVVAAIAWLVRGAGNTADDVRYDDSGVTPTNSVANGVWLNSNNGM